MHTPRLRWLQSIALWAEKTGHETGVTLLVGGALVTGMVTTMARFDEYLVAISAMTTVAGARMPGSASDSTPPTDDDHVRTAAAWAAMLERGETAIGVKTIVLRAARVFQDDVGTGIGFAYLQIDADRIDGFAMGHLRLTDDTPA